MNFDYAKDSKEQRPYEHYLSAYKSMDPREISERTGFPYDEETGNFTVRLMGSTYLVSFPDYEIQPVEDTIGVYPLTEAMNVKILIILSPVSLSLIMRFHGVRCISDNSRADVSCVLLFPTEINWKCLRK